MPALGCLQCAPSSPPAVSLCMADYRLTWHRAGRARGHPHFARKNGGNCCVGVGDPMPRTRPWVNHHLNPPESTCVRSLRSCWALAWQGSPHSPPPNVPLRTCDGCGCCVCCDGGAGGCGCGSGGGGGGSGGGDCCCCCACHGPCSRDLSLPLPNSDAPSPTQHEPAHSAACSVLQASRLRSAYAWRTAD